MSSNKIGFFSNSNTSVEKDFNPPKSENSTFPEYSNPTEKGTKVFLSTNTKPTSEESKKSPNLKSM